MLFVLIVLAALVVSFGFVLLFGAPYLPTLKSQQETALDLLDLKPGQTMMELGSGDGRMLVAAARRGINAVGYELNPFLFAYSWLITRRFKAKVTVKLGNFWHADLGKYDGVYVFLLDKYMTKLYKKITHSKHTSIKVVSFAFEFEETKHKTERSGLYLYVFDNNIRREKSIEKRV